MKLVVGLGNPGQKYAGTRHNIGFEVLAKLANKLGTDRPKGKFNAEMAETNLAGEKIVLLSPLTFMNLSGQSIRAAVDFYKLELTELIVICDDLALPVGRLRIKPAGSAGGQKGLADTIQRLGSDQFARLRVGIGQTPGNRETVDYVLGQFMADERPIVDQAIDRAVTAVEVWISDGVQAAMNQFNADPNPVEKPKSKKPEAEKPNTEN